VAMSVNVQVVWCIGCQCVACCVSVDVACVVEGW
jgi:hypothetical protein